MNYKGEKPLWMLYQELTEQSREDYQKRVSLAAHKSIEKIKTAKQAFQEAVRPFREACEESIRPFEELYKKQVESHCQQYDKIEEEATREFEEDKHIAQEIQAKEASIIREGLDAKDEVKHG